jgi:hypothetical protein
MENTDKKSDKVNAELRKITPESPAADFTSVVMKEIIADDENEVAIDSPLKSLLQLHAMEKTPDGFTERVMAGVRASDFKPAFRPLISRKAWATISAAMTLLIVWLMFTQQSTPLEHGPTSYVAQVGNRLTSIFGGVPSLYFLTFFALTVLLLGDHLWSRRNADTAKSR